MYMPKSLIACIEQEHPPYNELSDANKTRLAYMLWLWSSGRYQHSSVQYSAAFSGSILRNIWGNLDTQRTVCKGYFDVIQGGNFSREASSYQPMNFLGRALIRCLTSTEPDVLIEQDGKKLALPLNVILTRAANKDPKVKNAKRSVWAGIKCAPTVPINREALEAFLGLTDEPMHLLAAHRLLKASNTPLCLGSVPVQYEQKSTGRLVEVLSVIQSTPREVISAALDGYWDYDLSNAHFSILKAWANKLGHDAPVIDMYLREKKKIRTELAAKCDADSNDIKPCLISFLYGAALSSHEKYASIGKLLGTASAKRFNTDPFVTSLNKEIKRIRGYVVKDMKMHAGRYVNAMNISLLPSKKDDKAVVLSHALQGFEALALKTVMAKYGPKILLPMHDGWISSERMDCGELEQLIKGATGFDLAVEETRLPKYPPKSKTQSSANQSKKVRVTAEATLYDTNFDQIFSKPYVHKQGSFIVSASPQWSTAPEIHARKGSKRRAPQADTPDDY